MKMLLLHHSKTRWWIFFFREDAILFYEPASVWILDSDSFVKWSHLHHGPLLVERRKLIDNNFITLLGTHIWRIQNRATELLSPEDIPIHYVSINFNRRGTRFTRCVSHEARSSILKNPRFLINLKSLYIWNQRSTPTSYDTFLTDSVVIINWQIMDCFKIALLFNSLIFQWPQLISHNVSWR